MASASIYQKVDLNQITKNFVDVEYHPDQFPGLVFRLKIPKTATLIFSSGKMVCTGAKSEDLARKAVHEVVRRLKKGKNPDQERGSDTDSEHSRVREPGREGPPRGGCEAAPQLDV